MRQGRLAAVIATVTAALAILATPALAGEPPVHPKEGHWTGKNQYGQPVHIRVEGGFVRHAHGGGVSFSDAQIKHSRIEVRVNGTLYTATFRNAHHVVGTVFPASGRPSRYGWSADFDRPLTRAAPARDVEAAGTVHPEAGDYTGHLTNGKTIHFTYANHRIEHLVAGPAHDPVFTAGGVEVHHGHFNFGNERKRLHGHWCDHNHMRGIYETHNSFFEFHAHRLHHGAEGHRCP